MNTKESVVVFFSMAATARGAAHRCEEGSITAERL
jgi:hypothetical protein